MRTARSIFAGAALTACLALGAPAAHATGALNAYDPSAAASGHSWNHNGTASPSASASTSDSSTADSSTAGSSSSTDTGASSDATATEHGWHHPHGGMHTGGGGMSLAGGGSGLAGGAILLLGGLGAGAFALRRRGNGARATAAV